MAMFFHMRNGQTVLRNHVVKASELPVEITIPLLANNQLTRISFSGNVWNSWAYLDLELLDPQGEPVFEAGRTIEYYTGRDSDGSWNEGSQFANPTFRPEQTGDYYNSCAGCTGTRAVGQRQGASCAEPSVQPAECQCQVRLNLPN